MSNPFANVDCRAPFIDHKISGWVCSTIERWRLPSSKRVQVVGSPEEAQAVEEGDGGVGVSMVATVTRTSKWRTAVSLYSGHQTDTELTSVGPTVLYHLYLSSLSCTASLLPCTSSPGQTQHHCISIQARVVQIFILSTELGFVF